MRRFVLLACAVSVALVCLVGAGLTAHADDVQPPQPVPTPPGGWSPPPKAMLMKGNKEVQKGRLGTYCWEGFGCAEAFFPDPGTTARVAAGSTVHIRIKYAEEPRHAQLWSAEKLNWRGWTVDARRKSISLKPVRREGQTVAWDAFFSVKRPDAHYYLSFSGYWDKGDANWGFHLKTHRDSSPMLFTELRR